MTSANASTRRLSQIAAWAIAGLFVLGFFFHFIGMWTGPILGVWFVGTQKPLRGFLWMLAIAFLPSLVANWREFPRTGPSHALQYVAWMLLAALFSVLPFTFHRLTSPRLPEFLSTLPLPLAAVALQSLALTRMNLGASSGIGVHPFFIYWFAAALIWINSAEFRAWKITVGASLFAAAFIFAFPNGIFRDLSSAAQLRTLPIGAVFPWVCLVVALALALWALSRPGKHPTWANRPKIALLQSPFTGEPLHLIREGHSEALVSPSGERFPICEGIPNFLKPEELTGSNRKYNELYETIGGFYDDTQRVFYALKGMDQDAHFLSYLRFLEIKPGDSVLETSVGTGLNFKYLPRNIKLAGLDLSREMLSNCQANLRRWNLEADLLLGNAETLPFKDSSFDVVFHVGGINFFSDRAKAIHEMIRVAKPGSLILIADETEKHVENVYENMPITGSYFKNRKESVAPPIDLVPPQMQELRLEPLLDSHFYALTFRKPLCA